MVLKVKGFIKDIFLLQNNSNSKRATYFSLLLFMSSSKKKKMEGSPDSTFWDTSSHIRQL